MAISKKYSRRIVVDGVAYRWKINPEPRDGEFDYALPMVAWVQRADNSGQMLIVSCGLRTGNILAEPGAVVTPRGIAGAIRVALATGWEPGERGKLFCTHLPPTDES